MLPIHFEIDGRAYTLGRMDAFDELDLVRLIMPIIPAMKGTFEITAANGGIGSGDAAKALESMAPLFTALKTLSKAEIREIFAACLKSVERQDDHKVWCKMWNEDAGKCADKDVGMIEMAKVAFEVLKRKLVPFFAALASK